MRPNILYIHSHDTGRMVEPYTSAVETPAYRRLAREGVTFRQAFCANPTCSPSRAALLTGMWPHECGMIGLVHRGSRLTNPETHAASVLRRHGYQTTLVGVQHEAKDPAEIGYEQVLQPTETDAFGSDIGVARTAAAYLGDVERSEPFFLSVGFFATHRTPLRNDPAGEQWHNREASPVAALPDPPPPPLPLPDTPDVRADYNDFLSAVRRLDGYVGTVLDALDEHGLTRDTLVVCTTDHGIAFPGMKGNLTDAGTGVLLMLRGPGIPTGVDVGHMVSHLDVMPTLYDLVDIPRPPGLRGKNLAPTFATTDRPIHDTCFATASYHAAYEPQRGVRTSRYKYIRRWDCLTHPTLSNCDNSPSKSHMLRDGWADQPDVPEALYDLHNDPHETNNRIHDPAYATALHDMRRRLAAWMNEVNDPLLDGRVPPPDGYRVNRRDSLSPSDPTETA